MVNAMTQKKPLLPAFPTKSQQGGDHLGKLRFCLAVLSLSPSAPLVLFSNPLEIAGLPFTSCRIQLWPSIKMLLAFFCPLCHFQLYLKKLFSFPNHSPWNMGWNEKCLIPKGWRLNMWPEGETGNIDDTLGHR